MSTPHVSGGDPRSLLRHGSGAQRVSNVELFFDLVYVFAVTQLSHHLLAHPTLLGALQTALLLAMVWLLWAYTTWVTNWLDPERLPVRLLLLALMLVSLVMSAALPTAFAGRGLWVGAAYAVAQIGRSAFTVAALRGERLQRNFQRILAWCVVSGALAVGGGFAAGWARGLLWLGAVGIDLLGGAVGFYTPGLGRSTTRDWPVEGNHLAERCQAFVLIALGESIVVIGATLAELSGETAAEVGAFLAAFVGAAALWWIYFDRSADEGARVIAESVDPGRLGRSAYHFLHPVLVGGIIVTAAADQVVLSHPAGPADPTAAWLILSGTGLYLAGHSAFKATMWRIVPWTRLAGIVVIALLGLLAPHVSALALAGCTVAVVVAIAVADRVRPPHRAPDRPRVGEAARIPASRS